MAITPKVFTDATQLAATVGTLYTAGLVRSRIDKVTCTNTDVLPRSITFYLVPSGGTAGTTNVFISAKSIAAGDTYTCPEIVGHWLTAGMTIQALADTAAKVNVRISGIEQT